jgi:hypothetical protein
VNAVWEHKRWLQSQEIKGFARIHEPISWAARENIILAGPANFLADRKQVTAAAAVTLAKSLNLQNQARQIRLLADFGPLPVPG